METTIVSWGYIGRMEKKTETTIVYRGFIGRMEKNTGNYCSGFRVKGFRAQGSPSSKVSSYLMMDVVLGTIPENASELQSKLPKGGCIGNYYGGHQGG